MPVTEVDFTGAAPVPADLDVAWVHGSRRGHTDPPIQVHRADPHTVVLRQSKDVDYEGPFLFLLFGNERAVLFDTGATADPARFPLGDTVEALVVEWLREHPREAYELVVAHTHAHGDHVAGDVQLAGRTDVTVVGTDLAAVQDFFGFTDWPTQVVRLDLGGRVLEVTGIPGHHQASVAVHDPWTGWLLTGDTVYPGRLYVEDMPAFLDSLDRLVALATSRRVTAVLGCHVEMTTTPGRDYPRGATWQPDEARLPMTVAQLVAVRDAARSVADRPGAHTFDDVVIWNGPCRGAALRHRARLAAYRLRTWLATG